MSFESLRAPSLTEANTNADVTSPLVHLDFIHLRQLTDFLPICVNLLRNLTASYICHFRFAKENISHTYLQSHQYSFR